MPDIPEIQSQPFMSYERPVSIADPEAARSMGNAIAKAGAAISETAITLDEIGNKKNTAQRNLDTQQAHQSYLAAALDAEQKANTQSKDDSSDLVDKFNQIYSENTKDIAGKYDDPMTQEAANTARQYVLNQFTPRLQKQASDQQYDYISTKTSEINQSAGAIVTQDPSLFDTQRQTLFNTYLGNAATLIQDKDDAKDAYNDGVKELGLSAVSGFMVRSDYNGARQFVLEKLGPFLDAAERQQTLSMIQNAQSSHDNHLLAQQAKQDAADERHVKVEQVRTYSNLASLMYDATSGNPNPAQVAKIQDMAYKAEATNTINHSQLNHIIGIGKRQSSNADDQTTVYAITKKITDDSTSYENIRSEIIDAVENKHTLSAKSGSNLLKQVETDNAARDRDPLDSDKKKYQEDMLNAKFGKDSLLGQFTVDYTAKARARAAITENMANGMDRIEATKEAIKKVQKTEPQIFVPGIDPGLQDDPKILNNAFGALQQQWTAGKHDKDTDAKFYRAFKAYQTRMIQLSGQGNQ